MRSMRARQTTRPPLRGTQPPDRFVPAPRATKGTLCSAHQTTALRTSSAVRASSTPSGRDRVKVTS